MINQCVIPTIKHGGGGGGSVMVWGHFAENKVGNLVQIESIIENIMIKKYTTKFSNNTFFSVGNGLRIMIPSTVLNIARIIFQLK